MFRKVLVLVSLLCLVLLVPQVQAGPLANILRPAMGDAGGCPNCPGGTCPAPAVVEVEVTATVAPKAPKAPTIDEAAKELAKGGVSKEREKVLAAIIDAPAKAKALAGHFAPGTCGMLGCRTHPEQWVEAGVETQEQLDARTVPWGNEGASGPVRRFFGRFRR